MPRGQNSPRGNIQKNKVTVNNLLEIAATKGVVFATYHATTELLTANSDGLAIAGGVKLNGQVQVIADSSKRLSVTTVATKPSAAGGAYRWAFFRNTTGIGNLCVNITGTTWKYVSVTSVLITS